MFWKQHIDDVLKAWLASDIGDMCMCVWKHKAAACR